MKRYIELEILTLEVRMEGIKEWFQSEEAENCSGELFKFMVDYKRRVRKDIRALKTKLEKAEVKIDETKGISFMA